MKMKKTKRIWQKSLLLLLACWLSVSGILGCSCSSKGKTLLTLEKDGTKVTFSVNLYELMLSRLKGYYVNQGSTAGGYSAKENSFWDYKALDENGESKTLEVLCSNSIMENCKTFTAILWLFENRGLELSDSAVSSVDERMKNVLQSYGDGSKTKLNSLLSTYGVNYDLLREAYLMEEKRTAVKESLYGSNGSLIGTDVKDQYMNGHYVRFKQIFIATYDYVYETDSNGDVIYYQADGSNRIAYVTDELTTFAKPKGEGITETDSNGDEIRYTDSSYTQIAYDSVNGKPNAKLDSSGTEQTKELNPEDKALKKQEAQDLLLALQGGKDFAKAQAEHTKSNGADFTNDCYLCVDTDYESQGFAYLSDIAVQLQSMQVGDYAMVPSDYGYHVFVKETLESGAYNDENNESWFSGFTAKVIDNEMMKDCRALEELVTVSEKVLQSAKTPKEIGANINLL